MLKLTIAVLAVTLAGTASAAGWRSMRLDASSEATLNESVAALRDELPRVSRQVLEQSLKDIWAQGTQAAAAGEREYTIDDYLREVDGLKYKDVVRFTDPSGDRARRYFDQAYANLYRRTATPPTSAPQTTAGLGGFMPADQPREAGQSGILDAGQVWRNNHPTQ